MMASSARLLAPLSALGQFVEFSVIALSAVPVTARRYGREVMRQFTDIVWGSGALIVGGGTIGVMVLLSVAAGTSLGGQQAGPPVGEAVAPALEAWGALRDDAVADLDDPAEIFARSFRMSGRLQRAHPELLLNSGVRVLSTARGLRPRALADISAGIEQRRFSMSAPEIAVMAAGGALLGLIQLLDARPDLDDATVSDAFAEGVLRMFGIDAEEAHRIVLAPLPELPRLA